MLAGISLVQVVAGAVVGWTWITIKSALEEVGREGGREGAEGAKCHT